MRKHIHDPIKNKLLMLFIFDKMNMPLSEDTIINFCSSNDALMTYIDCKYAFEDLLQSNFLCKNTNSSKDIPLYSLTEEGRICLAHFFARIPISQREIVVDIVKKERMQYKRKQEYFADYMKNADGSYKVIMKIVEPDKPLIDISLNVSTKEIAKSIYEKWQEKAPKVYASIYELLIDA